MRARYVAFTAVIFILASLAGAQATRTWVSGVGDDANPCSRTAPCKTFAGAISKTAAQGEINVIDPGAYGAVTITKSITIDGGGMFASTLATLGSNGIIVNAGAADVVVLRNITIIGANSGLNGVRYLAGADLQIENVRIHGWTSHGVDVNKSSNGKLKIRNTVISRCGAAGVNLFTSGGFISASLENVSINECNSGVRGGNGSKLCLNNCDLSLNSIGLIAQQSTINSRVDVNGSVFTNLATALQSGPGAAEIRLNNNMINSNGTALSGSGGTFVSLGNNSLVGNTNNGAAPTLVLPE